MIRTMYQFGRHLKEIDDMKPYFEIAADAYPSAKGEEKVIIADIQDRELEGFSIINYAKADTGKYLFRELASARATSIVPSLHLYFLPGGAAFDDTYEKFIDKLERCIQSSQSTYEVFFNPQKVVAAIKEKLKPYVLGMLSEKKNYLFTLRIDGLFLGEIDAVRSLFEAKCYDKYFKDGKGSSYLGKDKTCSVTYQNVPEVWGRVDTLGFTVNDISFSRNGFNASDSYKMFPVSPEAVKILEGTMRALDQQLSYRFSNLKFFVLPHFVSLSDQTITDKLIVELFVMKVIGSGNKKGDSLAPVLNSIINTEGVFNSIISDPELGKNSVYYDIFFYEEKQAQFAIKLHVSDVLPSRFRKISTAIRTISEFYMPITQKSGKKGDYFFVPNFYQIKEYFSIKKERDSIINPYFYKIVEAVFYKNKLDKEQILRAFMQKIIPAFKNIPNAPTYVFPDCVKHSFCVYQYFEQLQLFNNMEHTITGELALTGTEFTAQHKGFFDHPLKEAAFFLGCATEMLLNHQERRYGGNKPFMKNLLNLYVTYETMGDIFHKLRKKADEYQNDFEPKFPTWDFDKMLAAFGEKVGTGNSGEVSKTEISYAFSLGMTMEKEFRGRRIRLNKEKKNN